MYPNNCIALRYRVIGSAMSILQTILITVLTILVSSCSLLQTDGNRSKQLLDVNNDIIAKNLIFTLAQVNQLHPLRTTLQVAPAQGTGFEAYAQARLSDAGYTLRTEQQALGTKPVKISAKSTEIVSDRYSISIGGVTIARSYALDTEGHTIPASTLVLEGTYSQPISLYESLFTGQYDQSYSQAIFTSAPRNTANNSDGSSTPYDKSEAAYTMLDSRSIVKQNMYETLQSNYAELLIKFSRCQPRYPYFLK